MSFGNSFFGTPRTVLRDLQVDTTTIVVDESNDRVGIGVADPDSTLEVLSTTTQLKCSYDADSFATITVADSSATTIATGEDTGDLTLDADNIILDSYEGKWRLKRNTTLTCLISQTAGDSGSLIFDNQISDADIIFKGSDGGAGITALTLDVSDAGHAKLNSSISLKEQSAALADTAAHGQLWVKDEAPCELYFTTDAGDDIQLTDGTSVAGGGVTANSADLILHMQVFS